MQLSKERIYYLLESYTDGTATEAEEQELYRWAAEVQDEADIKNYIEELVSQYRDERFPEVDWESMYQQIWESAGKKRIRVVKKSSWFKVAAVILVLILGGGAVYLFALRKDINETVAVAKNTLSESENDIQPGSRKAVLQAGNQSVALSSSDTGFVLAGNRVQISNGNVRIAEVKPIQYTLVVPRGGTYSLVLSDGTKVWLNADSKLIYPSIFTENAREVTLEGEAYFDVATDAEHPFMVNAGQQKIQVLGTEFNISAYPEDINKTTTLVHGKVAVHSGSEQLILKPGEQAETNAGDKLILNAHADINQIVAWKNGYFRFSRADIHTIMQQLARWYDIEVRYSDNLPNQHFGAIMNRDNNISEILKMLEATGGVHFEVEGKVVSVSK